MMTLTQYLLCKLAEEASEIGQIALKTQQFGLLEKHPALSENNKQRIHAELDDLFAIVEMLNDVGLDYEVDPNKVDLKKEKVIHYLNYAIGCGMVNPNAVREYEND